MTLFFCHSVQNADLQLHLANCKNNNRAITAQLTTIFLFRAHCDTQAPLRKLCLQGQHIFSCS